jgi:hypothetical protein
MPEAQFYDEVLHLTRNGIFNEIFFTTAIPEVNMKTTLSLKTEE